MSAQPLDPAGWVAHVDAWSHVPVDDVGYRSSAELLALSTVELLGLVRDMQRVRFRGWRNFENRWRDVLGFDDTCGADVLDFGCGVGIDAVELAHLNRVSVADIAPDNVALAVRVMTMVGHPPVGSYLITDRPPYVAAPRAGFDVFLADGVLHHCRWPGEIMARAHELLRPGGEVRLMLYSDQGWRIATGTEPPEHVESHPRFAQFVGYFDQVGSYADWYDADRLERRFGHLFDVERVEYLTADRAYLGAVLRRRSDRSGTLDG